jgi:4-hydroxy-tetrahydrodipicolinate synthase
VLGEVLTATVAPFDANGAVDYDRYRALCEFLVENGSDGVVVNGTTGEASTLSEEERIGLIEAALEAIGDRATVVAGTGTNSTAHSVELTEQAHEAGAHAVLVVTPYYNKPPPARRRRALQGRRRGDRPAVVAYNIPGRVVINIEPRRWRARRDSQRDGRQAVERRPRPGRRIVELGLDLYAGDDNLVLPFVELGGRGGVCVHTHVVGPQVKELIRLAREGDLEGAAARRGARAGLRADRVVTGPIQIKAALNLLGHEVGGVRLPLVEASDEQVAQIRGYLERLRLLEPARA